MEISGNHKEALGLIDAEDFGGAEEILAGLAGPGSPWISRNDLALCRSMTGDVPGALALLDEILGEDPSNGFARINRYYVEAADRARSAEQPDPQARIKHEIGKRSPLPLVTVVMPTFNRPDQIRESIDSVVAQSFGDWELIVVNDGGGREVEETIKEYESEPRVRYVLAEHRGLSSARNVGMALARGKYITQLDDDDIFYPDHLETVVKAFSEHPDTRVVYTDFYRAYQEERGGDWVTVRREVDYSNDFSRELFKSGTIAPVCNLTHHREALSKVGYYNEAVLRAMDWEYFTRLSRRYDFVHVKEVTGEFRQRSDRSQMTRSFETPRNQYRNLVSFIHGFFPLCGSRFVSGGQGSGDKLKDALERLISSDDDDFFIKRLELRKLLAEPYYALFYTLGKRLSDEGESGKARRAFRAAASLRPYEIKAWLKYLGA